MLHCDPIQATGHSVTVCHHLASSGTLASKVRRWIWLMWALICPQVMAQQAASSAPAVSIGASACPATFPAQPPAGAEALRGSRLKMQELSAVCDKSADYHAYLGSVLLMQGQNQQAAIALEKALLTNPELPGAQLDYAQALALLGAKETAQQLVNQVTARPDIDPGLRQWLQTAMSTADIAQDPAGWAWAQLLQTTAGHETNLASATHANAITLFLSNGPVLVPLDEGAKPQRGSAFKTLLALQGSKATGPDELRLAMAVQSRHTFSSAVADHHLAEISGTYVRQAGPGSVQMRWEAHHYRQNDRLAYQDQGLSMKYETLPTPCKWGASLGSLAQQYSGSPTLNGRYSYGRLEGACRHADQAETQWIVGTGQDQAQSPLRPGGDKRRTDWTLRHERPTGHNTAYGWIRKTHIQDSERYSPLLGDLVSRTHRLDWGVGIWRPLGSQWSVGLDLESTSQKSSNALLNIKNLAIYSGLRWTGK